MPVAKSTPKPLGVDLGAAGVRPRLPRRDERELRRRVEALGHGPLEHGVGTHLRLGGEGDGQLVLARPSRTRGCGRRRRPPSRADQLSGAVPPSGVDAPMPVTTMRGVLMR